MDIKETIELSEIKKRVNLSAKILDESHPGWQNKIDKDRLDMIHIENCISGQLRLYQPFYQSKGFYVQHDAIVDGEQLYTHELKFVNCTKDESEIGNLLRQLWLNEINARLNINTLAV